MLQKITLSIAIIMSLLACNEQHKATKDSKSNDATIKTVKVPVVTQDPLANEDKLKEPAVVKKTKLEEIEAVEDDEIDKIIEAPEEEEVIAYMVSPKQPVLDHNTNEYNYIAENNYKNVRQEPLSTFSIDVDNASYSIVRQHLQNGQLPPKDAVRIEEMINYFDYNYKQPTGEHPFSVYTEIGTSPWSEKHLLAMIGIKGKMLDYDNLKSSNLVFLIDTSGSMSDENKLPLLQKAFALLINNLPKNSKIAIVSYAGSAGLVLESTSVKHKDKILVALKNLHSGGSTAGGAGIKLAYKTAMNNLIKNGNNRVILATDGDFNVGTSSSAALIRLIKEKKKSNVYLSILGFGMGNYKDGRMEAISNAGNGNYFYIDNYSEAKKVFQKELLANLFTVAKDVKIQVEFNPKQVKAYRLIGYVNRKMANQDFNDDKKDAGELGTGHTVTALYEIIPAGTTSDDVTTTDPLKYQTTVATTDSNELMTVKLRYKPIKSDVSKLIRVPVINSQEEWMQTSTNFQFASAVAGFGMLLRDSKYKGALNPSLVRKLASQSKSYDDSYKNEFITLIDKYEAIKNDNRVTVE